MISAWPNPSTQQFTILMSSDAKDPLTIRVFNAAGKVLEVHTGVAPNSALQLGKSYLPGLYYAEVNQDGHIITLILVKQ